MLIIKSMWSLISSVANYLPLFRMQPVGGNPMDFSDFAARSHAFTAATAMLNTGHKYVKVYLVFDVGHNRRQGDYESFFSQSLAEMEDKTASRPIFFNQEKALQYMRFVNSGHCILTAYVPEPAIEGHFDELSLKKGYLHYSQVHGCFPSYAKGDIYLTNPNFDESLLKLVRANEETL